jgi:hypothetical protein
MKTALMSISLETLLDFQTAKLWIPIAKRFIPPYFILLLAWIEDAYKVWIEEYSGECIILIR